MQVLYDVLPLSIVPAFAVGIVVLNILRAQVSERSSRQQQAINIVITALAALSYIFYLRANTQAQVRLWVALIAFVIAQVVLDYTGGPVDNAAHVYDWINLGLSVGGALQFLLFVMRVPIVA